MAQTLVATAVETEAPLDPPPTPTTDPKTSTTCTPLSKETQSKEETMGEAMDPQGATQTAQAPQAPQKDNTDSVEPPDY